MDPAEHTSYKMVALLAIICVFFGSFQPSLAQDTPASKVFFNVSSTVIINTVLNLQSPQGTWLNFRTCDEGVIFTQTGFNGDTFTVSVTPSGYVRADWTVGVISKFVEVGPDYATNTKWVLLRLQYTLGTIVLTVDGISRTLASASLNSELFDIVLTNGEEIVVGTDFVGCMEQVIGLQLDNATSWNNVSWGVCPLEMQQGCQPPVRNPCYIHPCKNKGVCSSDTQAPGGYVCDCTARYEGVNCEVDTGPLCNQPGYDLICQNGGVCLEDSIGNSTYCQCPAEYEGPLCERNVTNMCDENACQNNATCQETDTGVQCICEPGFSGDNCAININECAIHQCLNGGVCIDGIDNYTCNCTGTGYSGNRCSQQVNECLALPCQNEALCVDTSGDFVCICTAGWTGKICDTEIDECQSFPCLNNGTCTDHLNAYECQCVQGFNGTNCELNIDDCVSVTCPVTFVCVDGVDAYTCLCPPGKMNESGTCVDIDECSSSPCVNGDCENLDNKYNCTCYPGFDSINCDINIDDCHPDPCLMNSTCVDEINDFNCTCLPGFDGKRCEVDIDECLLAPCQNNASCVDGIDSFTCECVLGFDGDRCENNIDDCALEPCHNGANCMDGVNDYTCDCLPGYADKNCSTNINDCDPDPCQNGGVCVDLVNDFRCNCTIDYVGKTCDTLYDACEIMAPCENGATCMTPPLPSQEYNCTCVPGFSGTNCEMNIDDCLGVNCNETGQICFDEVDGYTCACPAGYENPNCSVEIDECTTDPCRNNATCVDNIGNFTCSCKPGYTGELCEENIDECFPNPCQNGGICHDRENTYQCFCIPGFSGFNCQFSVNECNSNPCINGATCKDKQDAYMCICAAGFTGVNCEIDIDECASNPCENNSTCMDGINEFNCTCSPGYNGTLCNEDIDECAVNPCNLGTCIDAVNNYTCNCTDTGFFGPQCEYNIDDCTPYPCNNDATCEDLINDYNCSCWDGFEGKGCEVDIDECQDAPCLYGGVCYQRSNQSLYDGVHPLFPGQFSYVNASGFICQCAAGYTGVICEIDIDECESGPCANNGTCNDGVNGYTCDCAGGWEGDDCRTEINECLPEPCKNGATCTDLVNDYQCTCTAEYAGSNCMVLLIGCDGNECQNDATCIPSYDEATNNHTYTCQCTDGYTGAFCQADTSASFEDESYLQDLSTNAESTLDYSLSLQTTLPDGLLLYSGTNPDERYFLLEMLNGDLLLKYFSIVQTLKINDFGHKINDGEYHTVKVIIDSQTITLSVTIPQSTRTRRTATCSGGVCEQIISIPSSVSVSFGAMYIGGIPDSFKDIVLPLIQSRAYFTGCMRDIKNGGSYLLPPSTRAAIAPSVCRRANQCPDDRCSYNGVCTDLWNTFACDCNIGYTGTTCNESFIPATFRFEDIPESFAYFMANDYLSDSLSSVKLAFRTREPDGLIFYTEDTPSNSYIAVELASERLRVAVSRSGSMMSSILGDGLSNGDYHFVSITADQTELSVSLDPLTSDLNDTRGLPSGSPDFTVFSVGGVANFTDIPSGAFASDTYFKGCLWDVTFNNYSLQFEPVDLPGFSIPSFPMTTNSSILINECQSDDTCAALPCENNGTCTVTWNDFKCTCPTGFGGKNCSDFTICEPSTNPCPTESECKDIPNGHECVVAATFNGISSLVTYTSNISESIALDSITLKARTRNNVGNIYHSSNNLTDYFVTLYLIQGRPTLQFNLGQSEAQEIASQVEIMDGLWHNIEVRFATDKVEIIVDLIPTSKSITIDANLLASVITSAGSSPVYLGGTTVVNNDYFHNYNYFKGCLDNVRVGGILLPFYDRGIINSTSYNQFYAAITDVDTGCRGDTTVCDSYRCENSGTCLDLWNAASCQCVPGYNGDRCQTETNECLENPCVLGSTCRDDVNNYTCLCQPGFEERDCGSEINECDPDPCLQGSVCYDGLDYYNCTCLDGYIGALCNVLINETCDGNPCKNNATCQDGAPGSQVNFTCVCPTGFSSDDCGYEIDYCVAHECANGATCNSLRDQETYSCSCPDGYIGNRCETNDDDCVGVNCQNEGNCVDGINGYYCNCTGGYEGNFCQNDVNECSSNPCRFGATCNDLPNNFNCVCTPGFDGRFCSDDINECLNTQEPPCQNGGACMNTWGSYSCSCPPDTYGSGCQTSPCDPSPCENNANCTTLPPGVYDCQCPLGYLGVNCSVASCFDVVCQNNGSCQLVDASWECQCPEFTTGPLCQYKGPCTPDIDPCVNGGACDQTFQDEGRFTYRCNCPFGYNGTNCKLEINWCDSNPCQHAGSNCTSNTSEGFKCSCGPGYEGTFCEIKLPDCASNLCQHNATCEDLDYDYMCYCTDGYSGDDCENNIDECANEPCTNGGYCTDAVNGFICNCTGTGYQGKTCLDDVDECLTSPCHNNGTCSNNPGSFLCTCLEGWLTPICFLANPCYEKPCMNGGRCEYSISPDGTSVERKCSCSTDYDGTNCEKFIGDPTNWALIGGVTGGAFVLLIIVIILGIFLVRVKNKRATRGTYSPSRQEITGSRVEMDNILKLPPEERLI